MKAVYYFVAAFVSLLLSLLPLPQHELLLWVTYGLIFAGVVMSARQQKTKPKPVVVAILGVTAVLGLALLLYFSRPQ